MTFTPGGYDGPRHTATAIYFLLHPGEESAWHVVRSDELWFWHSGGPLELRLGPRGKNRDQRDNTRAEMRRAIAKLRPAFRSTGAMLSRPGER